MTNFANGRRKNSKSKRSELSCVNDGFNSDHFHFNHNNTMWKQHSSFPMVDRQKENDAVVSFQKSGDNILFNELYNNRIPSIKVWARKYHYLKDSEEDMFQEFSRVFVKALHGYKMTRKNKKTATAFNTYLYYSFDYFVKNLLSKRRAIKRKYHGADPGSIDNFVLSLDYTYGDKSGSKTTLKDIIAEHTPNGQDTVEDICFDETLGILSEDNIEIKDFLSALGGGHSLAELLRKYRTVSSFTKISQSQAKKFNVKRRQNNFVKQLIKEKVD
jgi:hypothetical protein